jgi:hypothetical protein
MPKLTEYADMAATEYLLETGKTDLDPLWIAEFFQDAGVQNDYPHQDLVAFAGMVQKELTKRAERAGKQACSEVEKVIRFVKSPRKT